MWGCDACGTDFRNTGWRQTWPFSYETKITWMQTHTHARMHTHTHTHTRHTHTHFNKGKLNLRADSSAYKKFFLINFKTYTLKEFEWKCAPPVTILLSHHPILSCFLKQNCNATRYRQTEKIVIHKTKCTYLSRSLSSNHSSITSLESGDFWCCKINNKMQDKKTNIM
jgi:hypothetical protein